MKQNIIIGSSVLVCHDDLKQSTGCAVRRRVHPYKLYITCTVNHIHIVLAYFFVMPHLNSFDICIFFMSPVNLKSKTLNPKVYVFQCALVREPAFVLKMSAQQHKDSLIQVISFQERLFKRFFLIHRQKYDLFCCLYMFFQIRGNCTFSDLTESLERIKVWLNCWIEMKNPDCDQ